MTPVPDPAAASLAATAASLLVEARLAGRALTHEQAVEEAHRLYLLACARLTPTVLPPVAPTLPPAPPAFVHPLVGRVLAGYRVDGWIGEGGVAVVYRGTKLDSEESFALKVLKGTSDATWDWFLQEARALRRVAHPAIARVEDVIEADGHRFLVLELAAGETLRALLGRGPLALDDATVIVERLAEGLAAAHESGVLHTDVKPENVMVDSLVLPGGDRAVAHRVKLLDLGLAIVQSRDADGTETRVGVVAGTPGYMAPEQVEGKRLDARCDVYALALVLYEAVTGWNPFLGGSVAAILARKLEETVPSLSTRLPGVPAALDDLLARSLDRDPARRPADAGAFLRALREVRFGLALDSAPSSS